jgi:PAS domain-containing protein
MTKSVYKNITPLHTDIILESINEGVFTIDQNMMITYFNRAAEKITGISREEAIGQYCYEVLRGSICEKTCPLKRSFQTAK